MTNTKNTKSRAQVRRATGTHIVEGTCAFVLLTSISAPLFLYFANMSAQLVLKTQVASIAMQASQACDEGRYWMGQPRPGFTKAQAEAKARDVANKLCRRVGLNGATVSVSVEPNFDYDLTICDVAVNAPNKIPFRVNFFGVDLAKLFDGRAAARGVSAHARIKPYALVHMDAPTIDDESHTRPLGFNQRDVAVIPAYGFFYNATGTPGALVTPYGEGIAPDITPENGFSLNHYHLKKSDVDKVLKENKDVALTSWNRSRRINDQAVNF